MIIDLQPCYRFVNNTPMEQMRHIREESAEVREALLDGDEQHALEETCDVIQSGITMLEIFRRKGYNVEVVLDQMKCKNAARRYYND